MRIRHHGSLPNSLKTAKISSSRYRLLHQVGGSRAPCHYHGEEHPYLRMEKHHLQIRDTEGRVSDNGKQFDNSAFRNFCSELGIKNHYSSPSHPQANEQVEVTNRTLLKIIKTRLEGAKGIWPDELPSVLWAYRTMARTPTGETPFRLTYGADAVIPAEIGLTGYRVQSYTEDKNEEAMRLQLDLMDEARATAEQRLARYQNLMSKHYNARVRHRDFQIGDLVLRKVMGATKDPTQGKLGPNWEGLYRITSW